MTEQIFFLLLIILSWFTSVFSDDTLTVSESLNFNQTLISSGQIYEAGLFTPLGGEPDKIYLGIWYYNLSNVRTVVWVANRDAPANDSSSVAVKLGGDVGGKIVIEEQGYQIWGANGSSTNVVNPVLKLLDKGNLVVMEADGMEGDYIWQSFDYPTDTLLPDQKLGWTQKTGLDRRLISWKSGSDPTTGNNSFTLTRTGDPEMFVRSGTKPTYRTGPFMGQGLSGVPAMKPSTGINYTLHDSPNEVYYMFTLLDLTIRSRLVMGSDGILYRYTWVPESQEWNPFWYFPQDPCDKYLTCGPYGVCDDSQLFDCGCPHGFVPKDNTAVSLRDGSHGCTRRTGLECGTDGFLVLRNMKLPMSGAATVDRGMGLEACKQACKKNCNCTAYANAQVVGGVKSGCVMWTGDLLDMRNFQEGGQYLYIRLAAADLSNDKAKKVKIVIGVSVVLAILIVGIAASYVWKANHKPSGTMDQSVSRLGTSRRDIPLNAATTPMKDLLLYNNNEDDLELPLYTFDVIVTVTNNFSDENKLGEGGFGCVYKGVLNEVQEIAIKRLSKESVQGFEEFKNEVNLIAKLQHRNLVKLLGYCVERDEKMLIYEYLRNRSLDCILFNKERSSILDWRRRFNIISGVARGLMYLHHDSRLRIIHRDLKASNVLLDDDMNPKISDFGMARIFKGDETETNNTRRVVGTYGYMSPEYAMDGVFSIKSDVFSFGVLVLEIVTGKKNRAFCDSHDDLNLLGYTWKMWEEGKGAEVVDSSIQDSNRLYEVLKCVQVGLLCVQSKPTDRPTMSSVILMLSSESTTLPQPKLPGFYLDWKPTMKGIDLYQSQQEESDTINQVTVTVIDARVARGIMYLHHDSILRIIHRDLKASNVLLDDDMNPKISDFGMARIFQEMKQKQTMAEE